MCFFFAKSIWASLGKREMGSGSSKQRVIGSTGAAGRVGSSSSLSSSSMSSATGATSRKRSIARRFLRSSCLGSSSSQTYDSDDEYQISNHDDEEASDCGRQIHQTGSGAIQMKTACDQKFKIDRPDELPNSSSNETSEWDQADARETTRSNGNLNHASSGQPLNRSSRFLSHFSFVPNSVSFRLNRATSLGSGSRMACPVSPVSMNNGLEEQAGCSLSLIDRNEHRARHDSNAGYLSSSPLRFYENSSANLGINHPSSSPSSSMVPNQDLLGDIERDRTRSEICLLSPRYNNEAVYVNARPIERRNGTRDPVDRNVRFSRTLSVGRLRDRVLRRPSLSDFTYSTSQMDSGVNDYNQSHQMSTAMGEMMTAVPDENIVSSLSPSGFSSSSTSSPFIGRQSHNVEATGRREARYHDLLEHRSSFLERRRRIRSQVRALQRMGGRFDSISGHERSCILLGQHRTGRCTCRVSNRDSNPDDGGARASISRIVMLAEALFEVLDEIHQQSEVLSSRPSISSLGSVPAPTDVVEALPVKIYNKSTEVQNEEAAQCYICLVEYEEGDGLRILPCRHEFHQKCVDKWLKEIHRVCPLCRGDICRPGSSAIEN